jgi:outer membrane protein OmpA-like peptidoglycan-associated protein
MPAPPPAAQEEASAEAPGIVGFRINFALDSDAIAPAYRSFVERIADLMQAEPQVKLRIEGHTDARGTDEYNLGLSKRRAVSVAAYLVERRGIAAERLQVAGRGESEPLTADGYDGRNRRVQFVRVD